MAVVSGKCFLVTGPPGVGKTTLVMRVVESLRNSHPELAIQGFYTREIREGSDRVGFEVVTLDGRRGPLASKIAARLKKAQIFSSLMKWAKWSFSVLRFSLLFWEFSNPIFRFWQPYPSPRMAVTSLKSMRVASGVVLAAVMFAILSVRQASYDRRHLLYALFWLSLSVGVASVVKASGRMFTNRPRLFKSRR